MNLHMDLLQFGSPIERGVLFVITLVTSGAIVQIVWGYLERTKPKSRIFFNKFIAWFYSYQTAYFWETSPFELNLHIKKHPNQKGLYLRLVFKDIRLIGGIDLQQQSIERAKLFAVNKKSLFYKETSFTEKQIVVIIKKENGTLVFFIPENRELIAPFPGKYIYEFYELWERKGDYFYGKTVTKSITINNKGQIEREENS